MARSTSHTRISCGALALLLLGAGAARADTLAQSIPMPTDFPVPIASATGPDGTYTIANGAAYSCGGLFLRAPDGTIQLVAAFKPYNSANDSGEEGCNPVSIVSTQYSDHTAITVVNGSGGRNGTGGMFTVDLYNTGGIQYIRESFPPSVSSPVGGVITDFNSRSYLLVTDQYGGTAGHGAVYSAPLTKKGIPGSFTTIFSFPGGAGGSHAGLGAPAAMGADGNLYGTLEAGGSTGGNCPSFGCGIVYQLTPPASGTQWTENVVHTFLGGSADLNDPYARVFIEPGPLGNVYGTAAFGGTGGQGGVFMLTPQTTYPWPMTMLYAFPTTARGALPESAVTLDASGNVYGTTLQGGPGLKPYGVVFELKKSMTAPWKEVVLYSFHGGIDGANPYGPLVIDSTNDIIGTTLGGGKHATVCTGGVFGQSTKPGCGTIFVLTTPP